MKISFLPAGDENIASSRIHVYSLHKALRKNGVDSCIGFSDDADVLFVQKKVTSDILTCIYKIKARGKIVIYDIDELGNALDYWIKPKYQKKVFELADIITTDTIERREYIIRKWPHDRVEILPACIDYYPEAPMRLDLKDEKVLRVLWFGSLGNIALFEKYSSALVAIPNVEVVVVAGTSSSELKDFARRYPKIMFIPWAFANFISVLQSCHLTCLMHDGSPIDRTKTNNKMITSIAWGVPAMVSRTPDYERTALESGVGYAIFDNAADIRKIIERMWSPSARNQYLDTAQNYIWNNYSPEILQKRFLHILSAHRITKNGLGAAIERLWFGVKAFSQHFGQCRI